MTNDRTPAEIWHTAVLGYWQGLDLQQARQGVTSGVKDTGNRAAVTGGKQMDALQDVVADILKSNLIMDK